jgi:hypothetical protein
VALRSGPQRVGGCSAAGGSGGRSVDVGPFGKEKNDMAKRASVDVFLEAVRRGRPGDVLVVDNGGRADEACIGDLVVLEATAAGLAGLVGGRVRDRRHPRCSSASDQWRNWSSRSGEAVRGGRSRWRCPALTGVGRLGRLGPGDGLPLRAAGRAWRTGCRHGSPRSWATCKGVSRSRGWTVPRPSGPARPARVR